MSHPAIRFLSGGDQEMFLLAETDTRGGAGLAVQGSPAQSWGIANDH